jgi:hypothetical protein
MQKREAGAPAVDGAAEEFLVLSFFHRGFRSFGNGFWSGKKYVLGHPHIYTSHS